MAVIDNGCGFEKDDKEKIFEAFYTTKKTGTGLGLAIVQKHILELSGQIKIESEKDLGTSIIITLPQN